MALKTELTKSTSDLVITALEEFSGSEGVAAVVISITEDGAICISANVKRVMAIGLLTAALDIVRNQ